MGQRIQFFKLLVHVEKLLLPQMRPWIVIKGTHLVYYDVYVLIKISRTHVELIHSFTEYSGPG